MNVNGVSPVYNPRSASRRKSRGGLIALIVLVIVLPVSMLLLPYALLYFIDPSIADIFVTYSVPYILITLVVILGLFGIIFAISAITRRRNAVQGSVMLSPQTFQENNPRPPDAPQVIEIKEREIVREIVKVRCHYCGTLNPETAAKCESCGANI